MDIGLSLGLSPREDIDRLVRLLRSAEEVGISTAWIIDSQLAMKDAYLTVAVLARETSSMHVGPGVTNLITRDVTVVANAMATLATFAPGRVVVGLGAGDSAVFPLGLRPQSIRDLEAAATRLRSLLAGDAVDGAGGAVRLSFVPDPVPPLYLAASQPKMLELAGRVADGVIVMGPANAETVRAQMAHVDRGALAEGRSPRAVHRDLWVTMAVGERHEALVDVKSWASAQARWLTTWRTLPSSLERFTSEMEAARAQYDFGTHLSRRATHASEVSDDLAAALAVVGPVEVCAERLQGLAAAGADRVTVTLLSGGRERRLHDVARVREMLAAAGAR